MDLSVLCCFVLKWTFTSGFIHTLSPRAVHDYVAASSRVPVEVAVEEPVAFVVRRVFKVGVHRGL